MLTAMKKIINEYGDDVLLEILSVECFDPLVRRAAFILYDGGGVRDVQEDLALSEASAKNIISSTLKAVTTYRETMLVPGSDAFLSEVMATRYSRAFYKHAGCIRIRDVLYLLKSRKRFSVDFIGPQGAAQLKDECASRSITLYYTVKDGAVTFTSEPASTDFATALEDTGAKRAIVQLMHVTGMSIAEVAQNMCRALAAENI